MTATVDVAPLDVALAAPDDLGERGAALWAALGADLGEASRDALAEICRLADARAAGMEPPVNLRPGWPAAGLVGIQEPRIATRPWEAPEFGPVDWSASWAALDLADLAGRCRPPWQDSVITDGMALGVDGKWAAPEVCVLCSRQNGKNGCIEVVELAWMVSEPGVQILHTAHKFTTAMKSMERLITLIRGNPLIARMVAPAGIRRGNGRESITFRNGSFIAFRTRTNQGGRGESFDRLVIDEAMILSSAAYAALEPLLTTADQPGSTGRGRQIWFLGSAPDADSMEHCWHWAGLRERAFEGDPSLLWLEWSAPEPPENPAERAAWRTDPANHAAANPSIGYLITEDYIPQTLRSARAALEKWEIERLSAGRWPKVDGGEPWFDLERWSDMTDVQPVLVGHIAIGVAMSPDRRWVAIAAAQRTADGRIHLEVGYHEAPSPMAIDRLMRLISAWDPCCVAMRSGSKPEASMVQELLTRGIEAETATPAQFTGASGGFYDDAVNAMLSHTGDPRIDAALLGASSKDQGGVPSPDMGAEISPLDAAVLARWGLLMFGAETEPPPAPAGSDEMDDVNDELDVFAAF